MNQHIMINVCVFVLFFALGLYANKLRKERDEYKARDLLVYNLKLQWDKMQRGEQSTVAFLAWLWPYMEGGGK